MKTYKEFINESHAYEMEHPVGIDTDKVTHDGHSKTIAFLKHFDAARKFVSNNGKHNDEREAEKTHDNFHKKYTLISKSRKPGEMGKEMIYKSENGNHIKIDYKEKTPHVSFYPYKD